MLLARVRISACGARRLRARRLWEVAGSYFMVDSAGLSAVFQLIFTVTALRMVDATRKL